MAWWNRSGPFATARVGRTIEEVGDGADPGRLAIVRIPERRLLALDEAAEYLGIRPRTLEKLAHDGQMPYVKLGRATRYNLADLDAYVDRNRRRNRRAS
jgi:excisionase family DNA binding protein